MNMLLCHRNYMGLYCVDCLDLPLPSSGQKTIKTALKMSSMHSNASVWLHNHGKVNNCIVITLPLSSFLILSCRLLYFAWIFIVLTKKTP